MFALMMLLEVAEVALQQTPSLVAWIALAISIFVFVLAFTTCCCLYGHTLYRLLEFTFMGLVFVIYMCIDQLVNGAR